MSYNRGAFATLIVVVALLVTSQVAVVAQTTTPQVVSLSNKYIEFRLGVSGTVTYGTEQLTVAGRFGVISKVGDPEVAGDDNQYLIPWSGTPLGGFGYWRLRVANTNLVIGGETGQWSKTPQVYNPPAPGQMKGKSGPYIEGDWRTNADTANGIQPVTFRIHVSLVRDQVRLETTIINQGTSSQNIGLGMLIDAMVEDTDRAGYPFLPGIGLARTTGFADEFYGAVYSGSSVPNQFDFYDNIDSPVTAVRYTMRNGDCVAPDYVAIGQWDQMSLANVWLPGGYVPDPLTPVDDVAGFLVWKQKGLYTNSVRKIVTYYGMGAASSAWTYRVGTQAVQDSVALAVQGPRALKYDTTDPTQSELQPSPFTIKAYVYNLDTDPGPYALQNVTAYLYLPKGLELMPSSLAQQEIGSVPINSESTPVSWSVRATGEYTGELEYFVSVRDVSGWQQIVSRKIMVPATKTTILRSGYQLVSVPFASNDPQIAHLFGLGSSSIFASYYDPTSTKGYVTLDRIEPGKAFWLAVAPLPLNGSITLADDARINGEVSGKQTDEVHVNLAAGWNMVGNPFVYPIYLGQLLVNHDPDGSATFDQSVTKNWMSRTVFLWNPDKSAYETLKGNDAYLLPWKGYWVYARVPVTLVFRPAVFPESSVTSLPGGY